MPIFYAVRLIYIPFSSLHRLFQELAELVDSLIVSFTDVIDNTGLDVGGEELLVKGVQARLDGGDLGQNIRAVAVVLDHLFDAVDLAFNPVQAVRERTYLLRRSGLMLVAAICAAAAPLLCPRIHLVFTRHSILLLFTSRFRQIHNPYP